MENNKSSQLLVTVRVGDHKVSSNLNEVLVTYSLGSCMGLAAYDPQAKVAGLLHCMLPDSRINPDKAKSQPAMFVDSGISVFLNELFALGATRRTLVLKMAGGSKVLKEGEFFDIGRRNLLMAKKMLWKNNLPIQADETGGEVSRTLRVRVEDGKMSIRDVSGERDF
jgi:chemotaxis protein CheD